MILFRKQRATTSLLVNSRFGKIYGSNCMDCRYPLRDWTDPVGSLSGKADAAETCTGQCLAGTGFSHRDDRFPDAARRS